MHEVHRWREFYQKGGRVVDPSSQARLAKTSAPRACCRGCPRYQETLCAGDRDEPLLVVTFRLMSMMPELASGLRASEGQPRRMPWQMAGQRSPAGPDALGSRPC